MTREAKISILKGIKSGVIPLEYLEEPKTFIFTQNIHRTGYYKMNGKDYSNKAYRSFCSKVEDKNRLLRSLGNKAEEDKVITIVHVKGKTIL